MKENEEKIEHNEEELNEEDLDQVQGGLMRKLFVTKNSDENSTANPAEAGGPMVRFL